MNIFNKKHDGAATFSNILYYIIIMIVVVALIVVAYFVGLKRNIEENKGYPINTEVPQYQQIYKGENLNEYKFH